ncbi:MAG: AAA family ATPase [Candidatus Scalindua sp.]
MKNGIIDKLKIENFTVFKELEMDLSPKINVIIGENGTGKTHLLKAAYALCTACYPLKDKDKVSVEDIQNAITNRLVGIFKPLDARLGSLKRRETTEKASLNVKFVFDKEIAVSFSSNSKKVKLDNNKNYERYSWESAFIPTKEVLSILNRFDEVGKLKELLGNLFDFSYSDILTNLTKEASPDKYEEKAKWVMEDIEKACRGQFLFNKGSVQFKMTGSDNISANMTAEGFRKLGMINRLIKNQVIVPGISGPLFWDEPEANINPKLMELVVRILLELSRNGQQIILGTHDYFLLKWFDLLIDRGKDDHIMYHSLYFDGQSREVRIDSTDDYRKIEPNAIADTFNELTKEQVRQKMGGLGK